MYIYAKTYLQLKQSKTKSDKTVKVNVMVSWFLVFAFFRRQAKWRLSLHFCVLFFAKIVPLNIQLSTLKKEINGI